MILEEKYKLLLSTVETIANINAINKYGFTDDIEVEAKAFNKCQELAWDTLREINKG